MPGSRSMPAHDWPLLLPGRRRWQDLQSHVRKYGRGFGSVIVRADGETRIHRAEWRHLRVAHLLQLAAFGAGVESNHVAAPFEAQARGTVYREVDRARHFI